MPARTVVILIHGIRTEAAWQSRVASILEQEAHATVIPLKYGYLDAIRFWCPFAVCRNGPIERLRKEIEGIRQNYPDCRFVVIAHSFGTYALSRILLENPFFTFDRIILCGSIIRQNFDWRRVENQILAPEKPAIINECGRHDIWPVVAKSISWDYGPSGTYGFGSYNVRDRFHPFRHSDFFRNDFVRRCWVPAVVGAPIDYAPADIEEESAPALFRLLRILQLRWLIIFGLPVVLMLLAWTASQHFGFLCFPGTEPYNGTCTNIKVVNAREKLNQSIAALLEIVNGTFEEKQNALFPAMKRFLSGQGDWETVVEKATHLKNTIEPAFDKIDKYDSKLRDENNTVKLISDDGVFIPVEARYWQAFKDARDQFESRESVLKKITAQNPPPTENVKKWYCDLIKMHSELWVALKTLDTLIETVGPSTDSLPQNLAAPTPWRDEVLCPSPVRNGA